MRNEIKPGVFAGDKGVEVFRLYTIAAGLKMYAEAKIMPNRHWTPTRMLKAANAATGHNYRRGQYTFAAAACLEKAAQLRAEVELEMKNA